MKVFGYINKLHVYSILHLDRKLHVCIMFTVNAISLPAKASDARSKLIHSSQKKTGEYRDDGKVKPSFSLSLIFV